MKRVTGSIALALTMFLTSCGGKGGDITGKWVLDTDAMKSLAMAQAKKDAGGELPKEAAEMIDSMMKSMKIEIQIKSGGVWTGDMSMGPMGGSKAKGTWTRTGDTLELMTTEEDGKPSTKKEKKSAKIKGDRIEIEEGEMKISLKRA